MRLDRRTQAEEVAQDWAASINLPWLCSLRGSQIYVRAVDNGLSIFDMPASVTAIDREQWEPLLRWLLEGAFAPSNVDEVPAYGRGVPSRMPASPVSPAVLRVLPRAVSPLIDSAPETLPPVSGLSRFVPRFLRPRSG